MKAEIINIAGKDSAGHSLYAIIDPFGNTQFQVWAFSGSLNQYLK